MTPPPGMYSSQAGVRGLAFPLTKFIRSVLGEPALSSLRHTFPGHVSDTKEDPRAQLGPRDSCPPAAAQAPASCGEAEGLGWIPATPLPDGNPDFSDSCC